MLNTTQEDAKKLQEENDNLFNEAVDKIKAIVNYDVRPGTKVIAIDELINSLKSQMDANEKARQMGWIKNVKVNFIKIKEESEKEIKKD